MKNLDRGKQKGIERLTRLAEHLRSGELGHKVFNYAVLNSNEINGIAPTFVGAKCGTYGCALGELPVLFPRLWKFDKYGEPVLKNQSRGNAFSGAVGFFRIPMEDARHLFIPGYQLVRYGGKVMSVKSTRKQVAKHIEEFIKIKTGDKND